MLAMYILIAVLGVFFLACVVPVYGSMCIEAITGDQNNVCRRYMVWVCEDDGLCATLCGEEDDDDDDGDGDDRNGGEDEEEAEQP